MKRFSSQDKYVFTGIFLFFILCVVLSVKLGGTVDSGDSIMHFLYSKYSFSHPSFFFNHWAKPLFVLFSSPFSYFGFTGIKIFNSLVTSLTLLFTYLSAKKITKNNSFVSVLALCFAPLNIIIVFSGLTEPLFALLLIISFYLIISEKRISSVILVSFLPFARSEGIILTGVFALFLTVKQKFRLLPLLATGHIIYSIAGYFYYRDFLWVFTKIPYAKLSSTYGSGGITHFINQITYVTGIPLYMLLALGIIYLMSSFFNGRFRGSEPFYKEKLILVYGGFITFLIAHSLFWYLGIFNSMGLKRVIICVVPFIALICLDGFNFVSVKVIRNKIFSRIMYFLFLVYVVIFPFTRNPAAINMEKDFSAGSDQILIKEMTDYIKHQYKGAVFYYYHPYISMEMGIDHFDKNLRKDLPGIFEDKNIRKNGLIIWDGWFSVLENGISLEQIQNDSRFKKVKEYSSEKSHLVLFEVK